MSRLTSLCALCDSYGCCEHGGTQENVHGLIPVGGQHQHGRRHLGHTLFRADGTFPRRLVLLNQEDTPGFTVDYGAMDGHVG